MSPEIPDGGIQKYFSTRALIYRYVYVINIPLFSFSFLLLQAEVNERTAIYCQINLLQYLDYRTGHSVCSPDVTHSIQFNSRKMLHEESWRFATVICFL